MPPVRCEHTTRTASIIIAVLLVSFGQASSVRGDSKTTGKVEPAVVAKTQEPAVLKKIIAAHWRLANASAALPPVQVIHKEELETQDWIEHAYDGGALRLHVSPGAKGGDIFAILVDTREARYGSFANLASSERYTVYHRGPYVVVVPVHPVSQKLFEKLKTKRWTKSELQKQLGAPSYHWGVHGAGWFGLAYVPQGLKFVGDIDRRNSPVLYQVFDFESEWEKQHQNSQELAPLEALSQLDYAQVQRHSREPFANELMSQREQMDQALANGKRSPDGRFLAAVENIGGMINTGELVIRQLGHPERRYCQYASVIEEHPVLFWLDARTIVFELETAGGDFFNWIATDAPTGKRKDVDPGEFDGGAADFGVSGPHRFWYTTADGQRHEVKVSNAKPHRKR